MKNRCLIRFLINKTTYELLNDKNLLTTHVKKFGYKFYVLRNWKDDLGKFDNRNNQCSLIGYFSTSKTYKVFNKRTLYVKESVQVKFDESRISGENIEDHDLEKMINDKEEVQGNEKKNA